MTILASELRIYRSAAVSDQSSNGGRMSTNEVVDGVKNNLWPDVPQSERTAGSVKYRKSFIKVANADNLALINAYIFVETPTPGDDRILLFPGNQTNIQSQLTGSERMYGGGQLNANVSAGASSLAVMTEAGATDGQFHNGDLIRVSNMATVDATTGTVEYIRLASTGAVSYSGNVATLTFASGVTLANAYTAVATRVASIIEAGTIQGTVDSWARSSSVGSYGGWLGSGTPPSNVVVDSIAGIEQTWTLTFTSSTAFGVVGNTVGSVGTGTIVTNFMPVNPDFSRPYFTLPSAGWGGVWASGDTLTFSTHPAAFPVWQKRIVPAGAGSLSGDQVIIAVVGESA